MIPKQIIIVGGGFYGLYLAFLLGEKGHDVTLLEESNQLMSRASYNNQARVHNGYHYPRSVLTALRSRVSFPQFVKEFSECIDRDFEKYYLIGRPLGKVTAYQFKRFCQRIGAEISNAPDKIWSLVNPQHIESCFSVREYAFDSVKLKNILLSRLDTFKVKIIKNLQAFRIALNNDQTINVLAKDSSGNILTFRAQHVFNCTYSRMNYINANSGLQLIPLKHEMTEMCLMTVPDELSNYGITVMCGPFFSFMPFPSVISNGKPLHSLSHVRYTPHYEWFDECDEKIREVDAWAEAEKYIDPYSRLRNDHKNSAWTYMIKDAQRYIPCLQNCKYVKSLWEVKTVLPRSEIDDSRPILCKFNYGFKGFHCIMGGKIDNIYDVASAIKNKLGLL